MDIVNELHPRRFAEVDDLLAFISIYEDRKRSRAYLSLLRKNRRWIRGGVCVDAGCGWGMFSQEMARLGARKIYAVEANPLLVRMARQRLANYPNVEVIHEEIQDFRPPEPVDVLVHEFFGQLLYDEDIHVLENLRFVPRYWLPDGAQLSGGVMDARDLVDETVTLPVLQQLEGVLVAGLFDDAGVPLTFPVLKWSPSRFRYHVEYDISTTQGDVLYLGLEIYHRGQKVCQAGECENWSYVWTPRRGNRFRLEFLPDHRGMKVRFDWIDASME